MMRILGISGSLRRESYNGMLLRQAGALLPAGTELVQWPGLRSVPPFSEDDEAAPAPAVHELRAAIAAADAVLVVTPEYNASMPGQLKNALDWASRPFPDNVLRAKPVAIIGASPSPGGTARAQADARKILSAIGAQILDAELIIPHAYRQFDPAGRLLDADLRHTLHRLLGELTASGQVAAVVA